VGGDEPPARFYGASDATDPLITSRIVAFDGGGGRDEPHANWTRTAAVPSYAQQAGPGAKSRCSTRILTRAPQRRAGISLARIAHLLRSNSPADSRIFIFNCSPPRRRVGDTGYRWALDIRGPGTYRNAQDPSRMEQTPYVTTPPLASPVVAQRGFPGPMRRTCFVRQPPIRRLSTLLAWKRATICGFDFAVSRSRSWRPNPSSRPRHFCSSTTTCTARRRTSPLHRRGPVPDGGRSRHTDLLAARGERFADSRCNGETRISAHLADRIRRRPGCFGRSSHYDTARLQVLPDERSETRANSESTR
jgi:hypothetical protein